MPRRKIFLATGEIYHAFNRSIAKEPIFETKTNLNKVLEIINFYRFPQKLRLSRFKSLPKEVKQAYLESFKNSLPLVEIYTYCFMPNHYHFLLKQIQENGIGRSLSNFQNSFAKVFNLKQNRTGGLFQNQFKAKRVETEEELIHISRYIHLNPVTSYLIESKDLAVYPWTSFPLYMQNGQDSLVNTSLLLGMVGSSHAYSRFIEDQVDYQKTLASIKSLILE